MLQPIVVGLTVVQMHIEYALRVDILAVVAKRVSSLTHHLMLLQLLDVGELHLTEIAHNFLAVSDRLCR